MAIENNQGIPVSYECSDLIEDVKTDILEFGKNKKIDVACRLQQGVKIAFDYVYDKKNDELMEQFPPLKEDEWFEQMTLSELFEYLERLNSVI